MLFAIVIAFGLNFLFSGLLMILKLEWIQGWPELIGRMLPYPLTYAAIYPLLAPAVKSEQKPTPKAKRNSAIVIVIVAAMVVGLNVWASFFNHFQKFERYETSPNGRNRAIVYVKDEYIGDYHWQTGYLYPVRARFFYERDNTIYLHLNSEEITFNWLDNSTLEIVRDRANEDPTIDYFRW